MKKKYVPISFEINLLYNDVIIMSGNENWVGESDLPEWWNS